MLHKQGATPVTLTIGEIGKDDLAIVGGKGANLGELTRADIPVPPFFVVTSQAYFGFLEVAPFRRQVESLLEGLDVTDSAALNAAAEQIKSLIAGDEMPADVGASIVSAYQKLGEGPVAVRSSATAEDLAEASFAGQQDSFLNVEGAATVVRAVQHCWASLFEPRAIFYRTRAGFDHHLKVGIAVVVQKMVQSERSGVMFTLHPVTNDRSQVMIETIYGLGEAIVSGTITPDCYVVDKRSGAMLDCGVVPQEQELIRAPGEGGERNHWQPVGWDRRAKQKLTNEEASSLARIAVRIEDHFGCPQDIEWAYADGSFYIVQARAVTTAAG